MEENLSLRKDGKKIKLKSATGVPSLGLTTGSQSQTKHNQPSQKLDYWNTTQCLKLNHRVANSSNPFSWFINMEQMSSSPSPIFVTSTITKVLLSVRGKFFMLYKKGAQGWSPFMRKGSHHDQPSTYTCTNIPSNIFSCSPVFTFVFFPVMLTIFHLAIQFFLILLCNSGQCGGLATTRE